MRLGGACGLGVGAFWQASSWSSFGGTRQQSLSPHYPQPNALRFSPTYWFWRISSSHFLGRRTSSTWMLSALPPSLPKPPHMIPNWALANRMDFFMTFRWNRGNYCATYTCKLIITVIQIVHCYSVTTIRPFLTVSIQDTEAPARGGVTITSQILVANSRRGSAAMGMAPSGWVNWWYDSVTCLPTTLFPSPIQISHIPVFLVSPVFAS